MVSGLCCILDVYNSENIPTFYKNENGTFTCDYSADDNEIDDIHGFGVIRTANGTLASPEYSVYCEVIRRGEEIVLYSRPDVSLSDECGIGFNSLKDSGSATMIFPWKLSSKGTYWCDRWTAEEHVNPRLVITVQEWLGISIAQLHDQKLFLNFHVN